MTDTVFSDISYYQPVVDNSYPYGLLTIRANDGDFQDPHFAYNLAWCKNAVRTGKIKGFFVYFVYRNENSWRLMKQMVGTPMREMGVLIDVESWGGEFTGNHSAAINHTREQVIDWLNSYRAAGTHRLYRARDRRRVVAYANQYDRDALWPSYRDAKWIIANYSYRPSLPNMVAHQFSYTHYASPFGQCDANAVYDKTLAKTILMFGLGGKKLRRPIQYPKFPLKPTQVFSEHNTSGRTHESIRPAIKTIQRALLKHGYVPANQHAGFVDGIYGPETSAAVVRFKKSKHFINRRSYVGVYAWNRLVRL